MNQQLPLSILIGFVTYNPDVSNFNQQLLKIPECYDVIIVDNSDKESFSLEEKLTKHIFIRKMRTNTGAAGGARIISYYALKKEFDFVVFFDQDTQFDIRRLETAITILKESDYGICYAYTEEPPRDLPVEKPISQKTGIFSGTILKLSTLKNAGLYNSIYFMEGFDLDYSLRCIEKQILSCRILVWKIEQQFGSGRKIVFLGREMRLDDHAPWRYYYRGKSMALILNKHGLLQKKIVFSIAKSHFKMIVKIVLFESDKTKKIIAYLSGFNSSKNRNI